MKNNIKKVPIKFWEDLSYFQHFMLIFVFVPKLVIITTLIKHLIPILCKHQTFQETQGQKFRFKLSLFFVVTQKEITLMSFFHVGSRCHGNYVLLFCEKKCHFL